jgi:transposase-like protein
MAETREDSYKAFELFAEMYGAKYHKAWECLSTDKESLLAFYDFHAEHWKHLRTTSPIESPLPRSACDIAGQRVVGRVRQVWQRCSN